MKKIWLIVLCGVVCGIVLLKKPCCGVEVDSKSIDVIGIEKLTGDCVDFVTIDFSVVLIRDGDLLQLSVVTDGAVCGEVTIFVSKDFVEKVVVSGRCASPYTNFKKRC